MNGRQASRRLAVAASLLVLFVACALAGGAASALDIVMAARAAAWRDAHAQLSDTAVLLTQLGSAKVTLPLAALASILLALRRQSRNGIILLVGVMATRLAVDGLKLFFARLRPTFDASLVQVHSLSFPSGHAANSLATFGLVALFLAPVPHRTAFLALAAMIAFVVGATRVVLGVHWFTDVVGGWAVGGLAILLAAAVNRKIIAE